MIYFEATYVNPRDKRRYNVTKINSRVGVIEAVFGRPWKMHFICTSDNPAVIEEICERLTNSRMKPKDYLIANKQVK